MFYFREKELDKLKSFYESSNKKAMSIYGRRRVGKTELILDFLQSLDEKRYIYFQVTTSSYYASLEYFKKDIQRIIGENSILASLNSFKDVISYLSDITKGKFLIVIDEFPLLCKRDENVMSEFQWIIDHGLKGMKMILLGSILSFMKHQINYIESPLYGRFDEMMEILPFTFEEVHKLFPKYDDAMDVYSCTGGVAQYVMFFYSSKNVQKTRDELFFNRDGRLFVEPENLLMQEFRDYTTYQMILQAIGGSEKDTVAISKISGVETKSIMFYINRLIDLEILEPVENIFSKKRREQRFRIKDLMYRFYYTFIYQNISTISVLGESSADYILKDNYNEYLGIVYEDIVRRNLYFYALESKIPFMPMKTGKWWGNVCENGVWSQTEIDVIAYDDKNIIVGECKHRNKVVGINELELLRLKASFLPIEGRNVYYLLASKKGFTKEIINQNNLFLIQDDSVI